ncbi:hypothetical protein [Nocardioides sp. B-3]|uniref:hypothetical protein n=1 Tax=Nocardioides sp. B-3 TaxID=2895565 RepID=UPI0021533720|nr:hypothetical protein [Nocardioides sp. B-3]UUZ58245.1 hypothetical protein LP418_18605 [Nocardioides sp. B-3]
MPRGSWSDKRERQHDHIKSGLEERGHSEDESEEIAGRSTTSKAELLKAVGR